MEQLIDSGERKKMPRNKIKDRMIKEIKEDKRTYLQNCREHYREYVEGAREMFSDYYDYSLEKGGFWYQNFTSKAIAAKKRKETESEKFMLEKAVDEGVDAPYVYNRLAILYSKEKEFQKAYDVCKKWFNSIYWKIPNMATTSLKLLDRMEKLEKKLEKD
jgi:hypothetical protein